MDFTLNVTLDVKRDIKHYDFGLPFWEATRQKKLVIQYCKTAKKYQHFPRPVSIFTGRRRDIEWREVSSKGTVFSFTIAHRGRRRSRASSPTRSRASPSTSASTSSPASSTAPPMS